MPYNASSYAFGSSMTSIKEPTENYSNLTTAQCAARGFTSVAVTSTAASVEGAKQRTMGIVIIVPTDQLQVTFGNLSTVTANSPAFVTPLNQTQAPVATGGFSVPPGAAIFLAGYNGPVYAATPAGVTSTIYFLDL